MRCISALHFSTMIAVIAHYTYSGRLYFSLVNDVCVFLIGQELKKLQFLGDFFHFYFLNSDISVNIHVMRLTFSVCDLKVLLFIQVLVVFLSQKKGNFFFFFSI